VIVNYRSDADAAAYVVATIEQSGGRAVAVRADVTDRDEMRELFDAAERHYGGLDIVVGWHHREQRASRRRSHGRAA
jgi:3-oxoacyl-[acyl-carrier protein] reductase